MTPFKTWMSNATPEEQQRLAVFIGTSRAYLYQLGNDHRGVSAAYAAKVEEGTRGLKRKGLEPVSRTDLCEACASCPYAKRCRG